MTFRRTNSGISNYKHFYQTDFIVYVEGGRTSYTFEQVINKGKYSNKSTDIAYWKKLFDHYNFPKTIQFKAVGSKSTIKQIALKVKSKEIDNTIVVLDRDYCSFHSTLIQSRKILYTYGYSWENDIWTKYAILQFVDSISPSGSIDQDLKDKVEKYYSDFSRQIRRIIFADIICTENGHSLIPKKSNERLLVGQHEPVLDIQACRECLSNINSIKTEKITKKSKATLLINSERDCCGKLIQNFNYRILKLLCKALEFTKSFPKEIAAYTLISHFTTVLATSSYRDIHQYYYACFSDLIEEVS